MEFRVVCTDGVLSLGYSLELCHCIVGSSYVSETLSKSCLELGIAISFAECLALSLSEVLFFPQLGISAFEEREDIVGFLCW